MGRRYERKQRGSREERLIAKDTGGAVWTDVWTDVFIPAEKHAGHSDVTFSFWQSKQR